MNMHSPPATWRVAAIAKLKPGDLSASMAGDETAQWVEAAVQCGMTEAQMKLGHMLLDGDSAGRDAHAAFACFLCAAQSGDADGHAMLRHCFENGWGTQIDASAAMGHYRRAATLGHAGAMNLLGSCYETGFGVAPDRLSARAWYRRAAKSGDFQGAYNYATMIAAEGCIAGALHWFGRALFDAPEPDRDNMVATLLSHKTGAVRALAAQAV